ncbi:MAG: Inositol monophosphatase family protein [Rickettsiaceae bacterium]|jgi:histidinol phosphatase-like enzyme (inositol monophosphatase family)|nr:Inositol monophosphatase family protein [Rickettsiaceae bacterium]
MTTSELLAFANNLVDNSSDIIRKHFRNIDNITSKGDLTPVTIADQETEKAIRTLIQAKYPDHGIQGEEFGIENEKAEYRWIIDPIDGTTSFMIGRPTFGTLLALMQNNEAVLGVIDQPISGERWLAYKGNGATFNGNKISTRKCASLSDAVLCTTGPNYFSAQKLKLFNQVAEKARFNVYGGDCYSYGLLAAGHVDIVVESGLKQHDFFPLKTIIEEAGGIITDWQGKPLDINSNGDIVASGDKRVHGEVIKILNG